MSEWVNEWMNEWIIVDTWKTNDLNSKKVFDIFFFFSFCRLFFIKKNCIFLGFNWLYIYKYIYIEII